MNLEPARMHTQSPTKSEDRKQKFPFMGQLREVILDLRINFLHIMSPVGIAAYHTHANPIAVFVINFVALIPLTSSLNYATKQVALRMDELVEDLLNASFVNVVGLIVSIITLTQSWPLTVSSTSSSLSNLLFVLMMGSFFGALYIIEQVNTTFARTASSLFLLAITFLSIRMAPQNISPTTSSTKITAVSLLIIYACYLSKSQPKIKKKSNNEEEVSTSAVPETPQLSESVAVVTLLVSTVLVVLNATYFVRSIKLITWGSYGWMDVPLGVAGGSIVALVLLKS